MARIYAPLCEFGNSLGKAWQVGVIDNHEAKPLSFDEIKVVCDRLNRDVDELERLRVDVRTVAAELLFASQRGDTRIKEAGLMQAAVDRLLKLVGPA